MSDNIINANLPKIRFVAITPEMYNSLTEKDPRALYFLTNGELYKGSQLYGGQIKIFDNNSVPTKGSDNKIYANIDSKELLIWKNESWVSLLPEISNNISTVPDDTLKDDNLVTKLAVKKYIQALIQNGSLSGGSEGSLANVSSEVVRLENDITVIDQNIGKYRPGDVISKGTSIHKILTNLLTKVIDVVYTTPSVRISPVNIVVEAGTTKKFIFNINYDSADGGAVESVMILKGNNNIYGDPIFFSKHMVTEYMIDEPITITDSDRLRYKVVVKYDDGAIRANNIGEVQEEGAIKAGTVEDICQCIGERFTWFKSVKSAKDEFISSSQIRSIENKILGTKKGSSFSVDINAGDEMVVLAYPKTLGKLDNVKSRIFNMDLTENFISSIVMVEGANAYRSIEYFVYKYTPNAPFISNDTFDIVI